jgi:acyl-coenzyme A thioesterase PaaI-like protein
VHRDPSIDLPAVDPAFFPASLMHAIGFDAVLRGDPNGIAVVRYVARPEHAHSDGRIVQGGFITSWLDHSMAVAVRLREPGAALASLDITVSFLERVAPGPVVVEARVLRWGGRVVFLQAELRAQADEHAPLLARATSTGMVLRKDASPGHG